MKYEKIIEILLNEFPELSVKYEEDKDYLEGFPYVVFEGIFLKYLNDLFNRPSEKQKVKKIFDFIEDMLTSEDDETRQLAILSIIEPIVLNNKDIEYKKSYFGSETKKVFEELELYYNCNDNIRLTLRMIKESYAKENGNYARIIDEEIKVIDAEEDKDKLVARAKELMDCYKENKNYLAMGGIFVAAEHSRTKRSRNEKLSSVEKATTNPLYHSSIISKIINTFLSGVKHIPDEGEKEPFIEQPLKKQRTLPPKGTEPKLGGKQGPSI